MTIPSMFDLERDLFMGTNGLKSHLMVDPLKSDLNHLTIDMYGSGIFDIFKNIGSFIGKIFRSPVTKSLLRVGKAVSKPLISTGLQELGRTERGAQIVKGIRTGKKIYDIGKRAYRDSRQTVGRGKKRKPLPASNLKKMFLGKGRKRRKKRKMTGGRSISSVPKLITDVFLPQLIQNMQGKGMVVIRPLTQSMRRKFKIKLRKRLKKQQKGGAIGAILASLLPALLPLGIDLASQVLPQILNIFQPKRQVGSGLKTKMAESLGKDIARLIQLNRLKDQSIQGGSGIFSFLGKIGKTFMNLFKKAQPLIRKVAPVAGRFARAFAPVAERAIVSELSRSEKGRNIARRLAQAKKIGKIGIEAFRRAKQQI